MHIFATMFIIMYCVHCAKTSIENVYQTIWLVITNRTVECNMFDSMFERGGGWRNGGEIVTSNHHRYYLYFWYYYKMTQQTLSESIPYFYLYIICHTYFRLLLLCIFVFVLEQFRCHFIFHKYGRNHCGCTYSSLKLCTHRGENTHSHLFSYSFVSERPTHTHTHTQTDAKIPAEHGNSLGECEYISILSILYI